MFCISDSTEFGHIFSTFSDGYGRRCYREKDAGNIINTHEMRDEMRWLAVNVCTKDAGNIMNTHEMRDEMRWLAVIVCTKDAGNIVNTREMRDEMRWLTVIVCTGTDPVAKKTEHGRDTRGRVDTEVQGHSWDMWVKDTW